MATILLKLRSLGLNPLYTVQRGLRGSRYRKELPASDDTDGYYKVNVKPSDFLAHLEKEEKSLRREIDGDVGNSNLRKESRPPDSYDLREEEWAKKANLKNKNNLRTSENPKITENHLKEAERHTKSSRYDERNPRTSNSDERNTKAPRYDERNPRASNYDKRNTKAPRFDEINPRSSNDDERNRKTSSNEERNSRTSNNDKVCKQYPRTSKPKFSRNHDDNKNTELTDKVPQSAGVFAELIKDLRSKTNYADVTLENKDEKVKDVMTILHSYHYAEQLKLKQHKTIEVLGRLSKGLDYSVKKKCKVERVIRSPLKEAYRSKDEFSVQIGVDGQPTVGFYVGNPKDGLVCVEPDAISIIKDSHKLVAKCYQDYIRQSCLPAHLYMGPIAGGEQGNWRSMYVRSNEEGDLMGKIIFHPQQLSDQQIQEEKERLVEYFTIGDGRVCGLKSLYIVVTKDLFNSASKDRPELLFGLSHITETMAGVTFRLGPETFYQINVKGAELLLNVVKEEANLDASRTLLDLCCGAGFFSIHLAKLARGCLGVDMIGIEDARENAELNGATNCSFLKGKVQEVVPGLLQQLGPVGGSVSVVLNPGREGVDFRVMRELRRSRMIDSIVYVSCHPESKAFFNFYDLLKEDSKKTPAKLRSEPFQLWKSIPIDMFPHTQHCEHVFVFKRSV